MPKVVRTKIIDLGAIVKANAFPIAFAVAGQGEREAKLLAPVDKGNLRSSIKRDRLGKNKAVVEANADGSAPYAQFVEFGTSRMTAQPYMRPTAQRMRKDGAKIAAQVIKRGLRNG